MLQLHLVTRKASAALCSPAPDIRVATVTFLDSSPSARVPVLDTCRLQPENPFPTVPTVRLRLQTGRSASHHFAMAGNDGDLLKQATQRMMARYEGELHLHLSFAVLRVITMHASCLVSFLEPMGRYLDVWDNYVLSWQTVLVLSRLILLHFQASFRTCFERQSDEGSRQ